ncbi:hypothetical protein Tco_0596008 [Tanacetum coccineum]
MASSHNQSIVDVGSENRPPTLEKGSYIPWSSRFLRYIDGKNNYGKMLKDLILNGPYKVDKMMDRGNPTGNPHVPPFERDQKEADLTGDDKKRFEAGIDAMYAILLGIPNDIYNSVDACKTAQAMWQRVKRLIQGTDLSKQELTLRLLDEFDKFNGMSGESNESYYLCFSKIMNDLERHDCLPILIGINTKFLNSLQPVWSKYVTIVRQDKNLHGIDYDQLYDYLKQNENNVNASRAKRAAKTHDPLALVVNRYVVSSPSPTSLAYYVTHFSSVNDFYGDTQSYEFQGDAGTDDPIDTLTTTMMLLAKAITQHYSTLTNNRFRASSNTRNQEYVQDGRVNVQSKNAGRNTGRIAGNSGNVAYGQQANGNNATVQRILRTSATSGNTQNIRC